MPIPFPKLDRHNAPIGKVPCCSNCGQDKLTIDICRGNSMLCHACDMEYKRVGDLAYRVDELPNSGIDINEQDYERMLQVLQERRDGVEHALDDNEPTRHNVLGSLRQMAHLFPDDNIVVNGDDLMTQLDMERLEGKITGYNRGFRVGFALGVIVAAIVSGAYLLQVVKEMRGF